MLAVVILLLVFGGIGAVTLRERRRSAPAPLPASPPAARLPSPASPSADVPESLILRLPEPERTRAWALLCLLTDSLRDRAAHSPEALYLLTQTLESYLPDSLRAYLDLTPGARQTLSSQGQRAEDVLREHLDLMEGGVREALRQDTRAADRLLTQTHFLQQRFGQRRELRVGDLPKVR